MKRILIIILSALSLSSPAFAAENISLCLNGNALPSDENSIHINNNTALISVRYAAEIFGYNLEWNDSAKTAVLSKENQKLSFKSGYDFIVSNNNPTKLNGKAEIIDGRMFVPIRALAECLNLNVKWNGAAKNISLVEPEKMLYEDNDESIYILTPDGYIKDDFDIVKNEYEKYFVLNFFTPQNSQLLFSIMFFDADYWNNKVKDNFSAVYSRIYENESSVVLCVNATDVQYSIDNNEHKEKYNHLLKAKDKICGNIYFFTN